jgi:hypothetical protein
VPHLLGQLQGSIRVPIGFACPALRPPYPSQIAVRENTRMVSVELSIELMVLKVVKCEGAFQIIASLGDFARPEQRPTHAAVCIEEPMRFFWAVARQCHELFTQLERGAQRPVHMIVALQSG